MPSGNNAQEGAGSVQDFALAIVEDGAPVVVEGSAQPDGADNMDIADEEHMQVVAVQSPPPRGPTGE